MQTPVMALFIAKTLSIVVEDGKKCSGTWLAEG